MDITTDELSLLLNNINVNMEHYDEGIEERMDLSDCGEIFSQSEIVQSGNSLNQ